MCQTPALARAFLQNGQNIGISAILAKIVVFPSLLAEHHFSRVFSPKSETSMPGSDHKKCAKLAYFGRKMGLFCPILSTFSDILGLFFTGF